MRAFDGLDDTPEECFALVKESANSGSTFGMRMTASCYSLGRGTNRDIELTAEYYDKAATAGSRIAIVESARVRMELGKEDKAIALLRSGVALEFIPAHFWLAYAISERADQQQMRDEVLPLMSRAAEAGHPGARRLLSRWKMSGRFGLAEIRNGFREFRKLVSDFRNNRLHYERAHGAKIAAS